MRGKRKAAGKAAGKSWRVKKAAECSGGLPGKMECRCFWCSSGCFSTGSIEVAAGGGGSVLKVVVLTDNGEKVRLQREWEVVAGACLKAALRKERLAQPAASFLLSGQVAI